MTKPVLLTLLGLFVLAACSEKPQELGARKDDTPAYRGTDTVHQIPGWKAGDAKAWDAQIKERNKGQDEYQRIGS
jgi:hypothetical protein